MKSVMKSVSPRICEKVANGNCTILVSKTAPKCGVPFKGYIYATKKARLQTIFKKGEWIFSDDHSFGKFDENIFVKDSLCAWQGKVIGECIIDKIDEIVPDYNPATAKFYYGYVVDTAATCLSEEELQKYGKNKSLYFWHISDLKIYGKPKELSEFANALSNRDIRCKHIEKRQTVNGRQYMKCTLQNCICEFRRLGWQTDCIGYEMLKERKPITRAPQSWQYVEEL